MKVDIDVFNLFLKIADSIDVVFNVRNNYLNVDEFYMFFYSDKISEIDNLLNKLQKYQSLKLTYNTLNKIKTDGDSIKIFFAIKDNILGFGFFNSVDKLIYCTGEVEVNNNLLKKINVKNSEIKTILKNTILSDFKLLHKFKSDLTAMYKDIESKNNVVNSDIVVKKVDKKYFKKEDLVENKLLYSFEKYLYNKDKWYLKNIEKFYHYVIIGETDIEYYLKIKKME